MARQAAWGCAVLAAVLLSGPGSAEGATLVGGVARAYWGIPPPAERDCEASGPRINCGWNGQTEAQCHARGCCFSPLPNTTGSLGAPLSVPACFLPNNGASAYNLAGGFAPSDNGLVGELRLRGNGSLPELGPNIANLTLMVENISPYILRTKIGAAGRWEVPRSLFNAPNLTVSGGPASYTFNYSAAPFSFAISRSGSNAEPVFNTAGTRLMFKEQYLEFSTVIPKSSALYGLGERTSSTGIELRRDGIPLALWNRDSPAGAPDQNVYGSHPILMEVREDGTAHGIVLMNSNAMDVSLTETRVTWHITGGTIDLYFLMGPTPFDVLDQLTQIIGRPMMPPFWSLGLMNSKYGYGSAEFYYQILEGYANASIPLDTFVSDSQYMDHDQDFTLGATFPMDQMKAFVAMLRRQNQRWVPILDPSIHVNKGYATYDSGIARDVFIKDITGRPYVGQLWPGTSHWPDFMNPVTVKWWGEQIEGVYKDLPMDGIWLDMNEVSNYCTGDVCSDPGGTYPRNDFVCMLNCDMGPDAGRNVTLMANATLPAASIFEPPYAINSGNRQLDLSYKTLPVTASHFDGTLEYNVHNLFSMYEVMATAAALQRLRNRRQFILTRSTFLGSGAYAAHWTGDTNAEWTDMRMSISTILNNGLAGISFSGADICGFMRQADDELCARWVAIGAWYPFARDHHADGWQELFRWARVAEVSRKVLGMRYRAIPYLYTQHFFAHTMGCPVARPLFFSFPADNTTRNISDQWMMGDALLVSPIIYQGTYDRSAYFPRGLWFSPYDGSPAVDATDGGRWVSLNAGVTDDVPLHVLAGNVVPLAKGHHMTTVDVRNSSLVLVVAVPKDNVVAPAARCSGACGAAPQSGVLNACGGMYWDGGEELNIGRALDNYVSFTAQLTWQAQARAYNGALTVGYTGAPGGTPDAGCTSNVAWPVVDDIEVLGVGPVNVSSVTVTGTAPAIAARPGEVRTSSAIAPQPITPANVTYNATTGRLTIWGLGYQLACPNTLSVTWVSGPIANATLNLNTGWLPAVTAGGQIAVGAPWPANASELNPVATSTP
ncbi:hypothetical protein WJX81_001471 [Elliptochloris bilobata]|uniref:Maltase n=1 Tax=Elliptochloris bilobata TaxID=381761 RepID=A0AAW1QL98_9CHLO